MRDRFIHVKDQFEGFHKYEDAPNEVAFLKNLHRHIFTLDIYISVNHDDRELEFFMVLNKLRREILPFTTMTGNQGSCEQIAERILEGLINTYGEDRFYSVEIQEDGENGGLVRHLPDTKETNADSTNVRWSYSFG